MFTFAWHALARLWATGTVPAPGRGRTGRRPAALPALSGEGRRRDRLRAVGGSFLAALHRGTRARRTATRRCGCRPSSPARTAAEWEPIFAKADCCVTVLRSLDDALARSAFHRPRIVRAQRAWREWRLHAGTAAADRAAISRCAGAAKKRCRRCVSVSASPRISRGCDAPGMTPSRIIARRNGPTLPSRCSPSPRKACIGRKSGQQRAIEQIDRHACGS